MLTFEEFKQFKQTGGYASVQLLDKDTKELKELFHSTGLENVIDDLHVTVIYDNSNPAIIVTPIQDSYSAEVIGHKLLGEPGTKWYAITLVLNSDDLVKQHKNLNELGFKHSYPEFIPHLSIKYMPTNDDVSKVESIVTGLKGKTLMFGKLKIERIEE